MTEVFPEIVVPTSDSQFNNPAGNGFSRWFGVMKQGVMVGFLETLNRSVARAAVYTDGKVLAESASVLRNATRDAKVYTDSALTSLAATQNATIAGQDQRIQSIETLGGLAPGEVSDATMTALAANNSSSFAQWMNSKFSAYAAVILASTAGSGDATSHIQARLNAGAGKVVFIPAGTYRVQALTVPALTVVMAEGVTLVQISTGATAILTMGAGAMLVGATIEGNRANGATGHAVHAPSGSGLRVRNVIIRNGGGVGVHVANVTDYEVTGVRVSNCRQQGISVVFASRGRIANCAIDGCLAGIQWWGGDSAAVTTLGISDLTITNCQVKNVMGGIWGSLGNRVTVTTCTIENCWDVGIDFEGCQWSVAVGNTIKNCANGCLAVFYGSKDCAFIGNECINDAIVAPATRIGPAFQAYQSAFAGPNLRIDVIGNKFTTSDAIAFYTDVRALTDSQIIDNTIRVLNGAFFGMRLLDANANRVINNTVETTHHTGIANEGGSDSEFLNNRVKCIGIDSTSLGGGGGIWLYWRSAAYPSKRNVVRGNTVLGFVTGLKDDNWGDADSRNLWDSNRAETMTHRGTPGTSYYGFYSNNKRPTAPRTDTVVTVLT